MDLEISNIREKHLHKNIVILGYSILLFIAGLSGANLMSSNYSMQFWVLTSLLLVHNLVELGIHYRHHPKRFFIQPIVLGSFVIFFLQAGGVTNYLLAEDIFEFAFLYNDKIEKDPYWLVLCMSLILSSSVFYWIGFKLSVGSHLFKLYYSIYRKFINFNVSLVSLIIGWVIGVIIKLIINYYGGIGHKYIVLLENNSDIPGIVGRLKVFENMSLLFLMMMLFWAYKFGRNNYLSFIIGIGISFEILFAITSGARGPIVYLCLALFLVDYYFKNRVKLIWILLLGGVLYFSMTVIAKYKDYVFYNQHSVDENNPFESIQLAILYNESKELTQVQRKKLKEAARISTIGRFNYVNEISQMIYYKNKVGLDNDDPDFITPFFTFPVFSILPKYYLFGISDPAYGHWVNRYLTGTSRTSIAISPFGFSYLAGGSLLMFFIFGLLGVLMKAAGAMLDNIKSVVGFILFLVIMRYLVMFDSVVFGTYINLIRFGLVLPPILWVLLRK